jgi:quinol-cytochrome oxidoreductase complex cytochrome b subunit
VYVTVEVQRQSHRRVRRLVSGIVSLWGTAVAIAAAAGIPLVWIWIASKLAGNKRDLTPSLAVFIATGIIVSYWLALLVGSWIRGRTVDPGEERARMTRRSWNRSFSDAPRPEDQRIDPIGRLFIVVAVLGIIAFEIWFFFYAGDPLPSQPAF